ncbi:unnamed protein product [Ectocarpus sp. 6 AP-2014]
MEPTGAVEAASVAAAAVAPTAVAPVASPPAASREGCTTVPGGGPVETLGRASRFFLGNCMAGVIHDPPGLIRSHFQATKQNRTDEVRKLEEREQIRGGVYSSKRMP